MASTKIQPLITVLLSDSAERVLKDFHCSVCGKIAFQYYTNIRMVLPGSTGMVKAPKVIQCNGTLELRLSGGMRRGTRCKTKYFVS